MPNPFALLQDDDDEGSDVDTGVGTREDDLVPLPTFHLSHEETDGFETIKSKKKAVKPINHSSLNTIEQSPWENILDDLLFHICSYLNGYRTARLERICKTWYRRLRAIRHWKAFVQMSGYPKPTSSNPTMKEWKAAYRTKFLEERDYIHLGCSSDLAFTNDKKTISYIQKNLLLREPWKSNPDSRTLLKLIEPLPYMEDLDMKLTEYTTVRENKYAEVLPISLYSTSRGLIAYFLMPREAFKPPMDISNFCIRGSFRVIKHDGGMTIFSQRQSGSCWPSDSIPIAINVTTHTWRTAWTKLERVIKRTSSKQSIAPSSTSVFGPEDPIDYPSRYRGKKNLRKQEEYLQGFANGVDTHGWSNYYADW
eukprot:TRINITY_DN21912_c0_g1_i1.p1 TRINITY_DN21912_c0_g1~~TRINITY_DN21912_c0_g1_i1.p1  ORF type:complete len:366 (+),score=67.00 TRINITY_DN21912_c0_g1_i1:38-1135(+)